MMEESNVNRVAKNTMYMYIRMILLMLISLYTSRILLQQLGVEDFGIFNVVGSIIALFANLRGLFTSSIQRFLNYEMGKGNDGQLVVIFNMGIIINIIMSIIFVLFAESIGIWYLNNYINIPPDRLFAAKIIFQISIFSAVLSLLTVPYDALIVAHERLGFYALMSIFEGVFKVVVIFLLTLFSGDKLIIWGFLLLALQIIGRIINVWYCRYHFIESKLKLVWDKPYFKSMLSFSGWDYAANTGYSLSQEGINMLLNYFGGVVVNAARGISYQVKSALAQIINNVNSAVNPFAIKIYAQGESEKFNKVVFLSTKVNIVVYSFVAFPIFLLTDSIVYYWLGSIPEYSVLFIKTILIYELFHSMKPPIDRIFHAANKMKYFCLTQLLLHVMAIIAAFVFLYMGYGYNSVFVVMAIHMIVSLVIYLIIAQKELDFSFKDYIFNVIVPLFHFLLPLVVVYVLFEYLRPDSLSIIYTIITFAISALLTIIIGFFLLANKEEQTLAREVLGNYIRKRK